MFRKSVFLLLFVLPLVGFAQVAPDWWNADSRQQLYPYGEWYSGFVEVEQQRGETIEKALTRAKDEARVEAASTIRMFVEKEITTTNRSVVLQTNKTFDERITEVFESRGRMTVSMEIPGLKVESYQDPRTKIIAAFAYVSKKELIRKTEKQITVILTKIEYTLESVNAMIDRGDKVKARETAAGTLEQFAQLDELQKLLLAVSDDSDALQLDESNRLKEQMLSLCSSLKHGIRICFQCVATLDGQLYPTLEKEIKGQLSDIGCEYVKSADLADWVIILNASTRQYNKNVTGSVTSYFSYVDAKLSIDKQATSQRIFEDEIHQKGGHTLSFAEAERAAYKDIIKPIAKTIKDLIVAQ